MSKYMDSTDMNTVLANWAKTCCTRALQARQRGDLVKTSGFPGDQRERMRSSEQNKLEEQAQVWERRAKVADEGYLLVDPLDTDFMLKHGPLISRAAHEGRTRFVTDDVSERLADRLGATPAQH